MQLSGIELRNFRSIGKEGVALNPLAKCNIIVGQNNAGKSNILRAVELICERLRVGLNSSSPRQLSAIDLHDRDEKNEFQFRLEFDLTNRNGDQGTEISKILKNTSFFFEMTWAPNGGPGITDYTLANVADFNQSNDLMNLFFAMHWQRHVDVKQIRSFFLQENRPAHAFQRFAATLPEVKIIPAFRQIRNGDGYSFDGSDLVRQLARFQHPDIGSDANQEKFEKIQEFARKLLSLPRALIEISRESSELIIKNDGLRLPLSSYGTGVHEVVILVTAVLSIDNAICCIEEPEIHLHPRLQRDFLDFIVTQTSNQYFIATHSPTFINAAMGRDDMQIFHLQAIDGSSTGRAIVEDVECLHALHDLGIKASDLLQSNCVIWVEGPSDRIYLKQWLSLVDPNLKEGRHFSIMFYGGRLLSHLHYARNEALEELIHILRINQHSVVLIDSDRRKRSDIINATKQRVEKESDSVGGLCWITDGREIENYLPTNVIEAACKELKGADIKFNWSNFGKFDSRLSNALEKAGASNIDYANDKPKFAKEFVKHFTGTDVSTDLKNRLQTLVDYIYVCNR